MDQIKKFCHTHTQTHAGDSTIYKSKYIMKSPQIAFHKYTYRYVSICFKIGIALRRISFKFRISPSSNFPAIHRLTSDREGYYLFAVIN